MNTLDTKEMNTSRKITVLEKANPLFLSSKNTVQIEENGNKRIVHWTDLILKIETLTEKLLEAGADADTLSELKDAVFQSGYKFENL